MTEWEARQVLLLRAHEDPLAAPWSAADRDAVSAEAERELGADAPPERLIARRAALAMERLLPRDPALPGALTGAGFAWWWWALALPALGFAAGLAIDGLGTRPRMNLFALPLLGMLLWNLAVYALLLTQALRPHGSGRPLVHWLAARVAAGQRSIASPAARFAAAWAEASLALKTARLTAGLHTAAAALAMGVLASMYWHGLFFEYRAGWESTFLDAPAAHRLVTALLGPAAWLSGRPLPDVAAFAALRFPTHPGEVAARWIDLYAVTVIAWVLLPRTVLAVRARWQARHLARSFPLPLHEAYFRRLLRRGAPAVMQVLPYSYRLPPERAAALGAVLAPEVESEAQLRLSPSVPLGGEDEPARWFPALEAEPGTLWAVLFPLTATPERETHGAFLEALAARRPEGVNLLVLIDEADFRRRFGADGGAGRIEQRRDAWRRLLGEFGHTPRFADLSQPPAGTA